MRQKLDLVSPPSDIPPVVYQRVEPKGDVVHYVSNDNQQILASLFKQVNPSLLLMVDELITPRLAAKVATLKEPDGRKFSISESIIIAESDGDLLIALHAPGQNAHGRVVCRGTAGQLFEYVARYSPDNFPYLVGAARRGMIKHPEGDDWDALTRYRCDRSYSAGLERLSKMAELPELEQEFTLNKFYRHLKGPRIVHYGAGGIFSPSLFGMAKFRVKGVDPAGREGRCFSTDTWQQFDEEAFLPDQIVSDVAIGDEYGLTPAGQQEMIDAFASHHAAGIDVVIKTSPLVDVWGEFLAKPRPHNLEIIVRLGDDFIDLEGIRKRVWQANRDRNEMVFRATMTSSLKAVYNTAAEITALLGHDYGRFLTLGKNRITKRELDRNKMLVDGSKRKIARLKRVMELGRDPNQSAAGKSFCLLPFTYRIGVGPLHVYEPGIGTPDFSFFSVWLTALDRKMDVRYEGGYWRT